VAEIQSCLAVQGAAAHKAGTLIRILNAQRKWLRQEDATYIIMHCLRIRENETAFRVSFSLFTFIYLHFANCFTLFLLQFSC
jgi:hypothetical protein